VSIYKVGKPTMIKAAMPPKRCFFSIVVFFCSKW
jgi:hypothetical protein